MKYVYLVNTEHIVLYEGSTLNNEAAFIQASDAIEYARKHAHDLIQDKFNEAIITSLKPSRISEQELVENDTTIVAEVQYQGSQDDTTVEVYVSKMKVE